DRDPRADLLALLPGPRRRVPAGHGSGHRALRPPPAEHAQAMNFRPQGHRDEPEINLIPFIDILLVVVIFLVLTTTYSKFTELKVNLPVADAEAPKQNPKEVVVTVGADGRYAVNRTVLEGTGVEL